MSFDDLPPQPPLRHPAAAAYAKTTLARSRDALTQVQIRADLAYGGQIHQRLDIYLPRSAPGRPLPVLVFWHGGRWRAGYKEWNGFMAPALTELPMILVSPAYGLSPSWRFPQPLHDCLRALAWVQMHIAEYHGDPRRVWLGGHSAGGHLAALSALRRDLHADHGVDSTALRGCLPVSATLDLEADDEETAEVRAILFAAAPAPHELVAASPLRHIGPDAPPFHLCYGERDFPRVVASNRVFAAALARHGLDFTQTRLAGCDHFDAHLTLVDADSGWLAALAAAGRGLPQRP